MTSLKHYGITAHFFRVILVLLSPKHGVTSKISFAGICCFLVCPFLFVDLFPPRLRRPLLPFHSCVFNPPPHCFNSDYGVFSWLRYFPVHSLAWVVREQSGACTRLGSGPCPSALVREEEVPVALLPPHIGHPPVSSGRFLHRYIASGA